MWGSHESGVVASPPRFELEVEMEPEILFRESGHVLEVLGSLPTCTRHM